jgi:hypothetical protein
VISKGKKIMFEDLINEHHAVVASDEVRVVFMFFLSLFCYLSNYDFLVDRLMSLGSCVRIVTLRHNDCILHL